MTTQKQRTANTGLAKVPSYYDEPEKLVDGKHQAIIDKATWWAVQSKLSGKQSNRHSNDEVPLRGCLHCHCGRILTAGNSKGRNEYYWYYVCPTCKKNLPAKKLHKQFEDILNILSLPDHYIAELQNNVLDLIDDELKARNNAVSTKDRELKAVEEKLDNLEEKYISNGVNQETYEKWKIRYENERYLLEGQLDGLKAPLAEAWAKYSENLHRLGNLHYLYNMADIHGKKSFVEMVFDNKLSYKEGSYRTAFLIPAFGLQAAPLKEKGLLLIEQPLHFSSNFALSAPNRQNFEPDKKFLL